MPLIGFTIGGILVAIVAAFHDFPTALLVWLVLFLVYQQLQDRVVQPLFYKNAVRIHPAAAVIVVLAGAQLAGILGALLAIPVAASLAAIFDEIWPAPKDDQPEAGVSGADAGRRRPAPRRSAPASAPACARRAARTSARGRTAAPRASAAWRAAPL